MTCLFQRQEPVHRLDLGFKINLGPCVFMHRSLDSGWPFSFGQYIYTQMYFVLAPNYEALVVLTYT